MTVSRDLYHLTATRGPTGRAPLPPAWLHDADMPIDVIPAGTPLARVHRLTHSPIFFGPGAGVPPTYRFDSLSGAFGVLYVGMRLPVALVETLLRNPSRKMVDYAEIAARASSLLHSERDLHLARLRGNGLQRLGRDNAISTGPYDVCGAWADALWHHPSKPDGIAYQSRHDSSEICLALFERTDFVLHAAPLERLIDQLPMMLDVLSRYGKSVTGVPC